MATERHRAAAPQDRQGLMAQTGDVVGGIHTAEKNQTRTVVYDAPVARNAEEAVRELLS